MSVRETNKTPILGLLLRTTGIVAFAQSFKKNMVLIENAIAALQGGTGITADEVVYNGSVDSNSGADTVAAALDDLYTKYAALEARTDSNSAG